MGERFRVLILLVVLVGVGVLLGSSLAQWWAPASPVPQLDTRPVFQGRIRVEVLNAGGQSGVAREATGLLRDLGLDVVYYGNAGTFTDEPSVVLDRVGGLEDARKVADALGIRVVRSEPDSNLFVDLSVRLGPEWSLGMDTEEQGRETPPWWDVRRFFNRADTAGVHDPEGSKE
jgi:hypothetical protein